MVSVPLHDYPSLLPSNLHTISLHLSSSLHAASSLLVSMYAVQQGIGLSKHDPEAKSFLGEKLAELDVVSVGLFRELRRWHV